MTAANRITALEARIAALETRLATLEGRTTFSQVFAPPAPALSICKYCGLPFAQCRGHITCGQSGNSQISA